jgi:hypothetical protein
MSPRDNSSHPSKQLLSGLKTPLTRGPAAQFAHLAAKVTIESAGAQGMVCQF